MKWLLIFIIFLTFIPQTVFAADITSGIGLYQAVKTAIRLDSGGKPQTPHDEMDAAGAVGYLLGYIEGLASYQTTMYHHMFPNTIYSEEERQGKARDMRYQRIKIPSKGIDSDEALFIYKKYAENHPEELHNRSSVCVFNALFEAYGWE